MDNVQKENNGMNVTSSLTFRSCEHGNEHSGSIKCWEFLE
jgi:hypothetical protein